MTEEVVIRKLVVLLLEDVDGGGDPCHENVGVTGGDVGGGTSTEGLDGVSTEDVELRLAELFEGAAVLEEGVAPVVRCVKTSYTRYEIRRLYLD